ncbi:MAG: elongator complex protein 3 [Candidatus Woesearchaeota archaeon]|nr:elongator complex protein 3 [Candidatus Woesearchaeota archaeon]
MDSKEINRLKKEYSKRYHLKKIPSNSELRNLLSQKEREELSDALFTKPSRTASGVAICAIMTPPSRCPHGKCRMCPGGIKSPFGDVPQSYTGIEPAARRAVRNQYDPYRQVFNRLEQYVLLGHNINKIELIIMGGTFPALPYSFQEEFVMYAFKAMNDFSDLFFKDGKIDFERFSEFFMLQRNKDDKEREMILKQRVLELKGESSLKKEHKRNEKSYVRCVGLTIETRPDYADGKKLLALGCTRVELGIQSTKERALKEINRGHSVKDSIKAVKELKNQGFKLVFHIMIGLPSSSVEGDIKMIKELFDNPDFRPDMLKIYPCIVVKGTELYKDYIEGKYKPLTTEEAVKIISEAFQYIPEYCRVMRIQRDIPEQNIYAGPNKTNLRQYVDEAIKGKRIMEIRHREAGRNKVKDSESKIFIKRYKASGANEYFISYESTDREVLYGFCRLRIVDERAFIRELHVYGKSAPLGKEGEIQHKGIGNLLLKEAERIASEKKVNTILVISGVGVREYYKKRGYRLYKGYMRKDIFK